jgi:hypothetical protein
VTASIFSDADPVGVFPGAAAALPVTTVAGGAVQAPSHHRRALRPAARSVAEAHAKAPWALAAVLLLLALLVAPEQPRFQEAICHRHNGVAACRVW